MEQHPPKPTATWSTTHDCWLEYDDEPDSLFSVPSVVWSETFPTSAMWDRSGVYELPMSAPLTDGSGTSSLLPTPVTEPDTGNGHARNLGKEIRLLQTPSVADATGGHATRGGARSGELLLNGQVKTLSSPAPAPATPTEPDSTATAAWTCERR